MSGVQGKCVICQRVLLLSPETRECHLPDCQMPPTSEGRMSYLRDRALRWVVNFPIPHSREIGEILEYLESLLTTPQEPDHWIPDDDGDWWCPCCKEALDSARVTFEERCDTCGTPAVIAKAYTYQPQEPVGYFIEYQDSNLGWISYNIVVGKPREDLFPPPDFRVRPVYLHPPLAVESDKLKEALAWCAQQTWEGLDIDGGDFQDMMLKLGLFVEVPASPEVKEAWDTDTMYALSWRR